MSTVYRKDVPKFIQEARAEAFHQPILNIYQIEQVVEEELWSVNWLEDFAFQPYELYFEKEILISTERKEKLVQLEVALLNK